MKVFSTAEFKQKIHSISAQMWQYNSGLHTLENKNGKWKYLHEQWTLPLKEEKEEILIETLHGQVLELKDINEVVLENETESTSKLHMRRKIRDYFSLPYLILKHKLPSRLKSHSNMDKKFSC